jgi:type VI secretion system protein ImpC
MSDTFSFGELEAEATMEERPGLAEPETPFRIALMGDWSGRANRRPPAQDIAELKPLLIDRDNFDEVMAQLNITLRLPVTDDGPHLTLSFRELDDFHPDRIFERVGLFDALRETRERLEDSSTFAEAARQVRGWANATDSQKAFASSGEQQSETASESTAPVDGGSLLEQMLAETGDAQETKPAADDDLQAMLREVVRPHLVWFDEAEQEQLVASVDEATSRLMRSILHHADFQSLEAAWRAAYFLTSNLETGTDLKLYLLDVTKDELASDLSATEKLEETGAYRLLVEQSVNTFGGDLWATLAGNYTFEATRADALMLGRLAKIAERAGAPFIAAAASGLVGCQSLAQTPDSDDWQQQLDSQDADAWNALRQLEQASYLGLALPRFLLRLPYGAATEPTETFDFEEMSDEPEHENYLWANPSFACAYLLAQSFSEYGWNLQPGILQEIEGLPLHIYQHDGDSYIKPCAETILTMRAAEKILDAGLMPLLSFQGRDTVRLARFQSLSAPATPLAGRWD